jgi:hypothetical protein
MGWFDPQPYEDLLDKLWRDRTSWWSAKDATTLEEQITRNCPRLVGGNSESDVGEFGFASLRTALADTYPDVDELAKRVRVLALSRPAADHGLPDWAPYYISRDADDRLIYASTRYAEPSAWATLESATTTHTTQTGTTPPGKTYNDTNGLYYDDKGWYLPDQVTQDPVHLERFHDGRGNVYVHGRPWTPPVEVTDQSGRVYDQQVGRWRRRDETSGEFEFWHNEHEVWERQGADGLWYRSHTGSGRWLPYHQPSDTWLFDGQWRAGHLIAAQGQAPQPVVDGTELTAVLAESRETELRETIAEIRAEGIEPGELSDEKIRAMFDAQMMASLGAGSGDVREGELP